MTRSHTEIVRRRFDRDAQSFNAIYRADGSRVSRWFNRVFRKAIFERYEITFAEAGDVTGRAVLDVGCGSGVYSVDFACQARDASWVSTSRPTSWRSPSSRRPHMVSPIVASFVERLRHVRHR